MLNQTFFDYKPDRIKYLDRSTRLQRWADCEIFQFESSPDPQNFWKSSLWSAHVKSWIYILPHEAKAPLELFCLLANVIGWKQNNCSSTFASWGKIDIAIWHFQSLTRQCLFCLMKQKRALVILPLGDFDCSNDKDDAGYTWISIKSL